MVNNIKSRILFLFSLITTLLFSSFVIGAVEPSLESVTERQLSLDNLVIALKPDKNPDKMLEEKKALENYFSARLGCPVDVIIPLSTAVIIQGMANGTIDLAYLSSTGAVSALDRDIADPFLAGEIDGKTYYFSYWVGLKTAPYQNVEALKGKPIAFASRTSTSGFLIPMWDLYQKDYLTVGEGPEHFFGAENVYYGVGYVSAIERVLSGEAEAAAVSYYVLDKGRHLSPEQRAQLKKIASQGPVPTHVIAVRRSLEPQDKALLKDMLLSLNQENPELRDKVFNSKLVEVNPEEHLRVTREALEFVAEIE